MPPLLQLQSVRLSFGGTPLLDGADLVVEAGDRLCLVGRNGSGKSTLLRIAAGALPPDSGARFAQPGATVRYLPQDPDLGGHATTLDYVESDLSSPGDRHRGRALLGKLGLSGDEDPKTLSGGEARRAALARVLAPSPDILLLDEPTNHLDLPAIAWLEAELATLAAAVVLISHDRRLLDSISRGVIWLDRGATRRFDQGFAAFEPWRDAVLEQQERDRHKLARRIAAEEDWLRYGVTARRKRNQKRLAGLLDLREQRRRARGPTGVAALATAEGDPSGKIVIDAEAIGKSYPGAPGTAGAPVVRGLTLRVLRGDRLAIVGPNGAGKTTLLSLLTGRLEPDSGRVRLGAALRMESLDQRRGGLDPARSLADTLTGGRGDLVAVGGQSRHVTGYLKDFLFDPGQARMPVGNLSGGEQGRLALALALARPSNLLVLDEPTNDLDLETLDLLQELLADYTGTLLLVSHDRDFLDRVATGVLNSEGGGRWVEYAGGYSDMLAQGGLAQSGLARGGRPVPLRETAGAGSSRRRTPEPEPEPETGPARDAARLSFGDLHALRNLPDEIARIEGEIARGEAVLADPDLYVRDPDAFGRTSAALVRAQAALSEAEDRWLELEMRREELARRA